MDTLVTSEVKRYKQWMIGATKPPMLVLPKLTFAENPERSCNLKGSVIRKYLQYEKQTFGINLGWTDDGSNETGNTVARWFFARKGNSEAPIGYGETIALGNGKSPSFLRYKKRPVGINLDWSEQPVFEWKLLGGKIGDPVHTQEWLAIYNEKAKECLIHFNRTAGGDIGWPSSPSWDEALVSVLKDVASTVTKEAWDKAKQAAVAALLAGVLVS